MSYMRFGLMILTSTLVMFILMYLNTYAWEHLFFSETRAYMAVLMGATMAIVMLAFMFGMYSNTALNVAILASAAVAFAASLWLVRSQETVSGPSYMRAMIPHHSIAIMTSERAGIRDPRVRKLADEIIEAQRREIAEMRYLVAEISAGQTVESIYEDPPADPGSVEDALSNTLISKLDLEPMGAEQADRILPAGSRCTFSRSRETDPVLWTTASGNAAAVKLNGILIALESTGEQQNGVSRYSASGMDITLRPLADEADWRQNADLLFELRPGLRAGYRGFHDCEAG